jgi:ATP-binding cassette subfamily E protein 1
VCDLLKQKDELGNQEEITRLFDLSNVQDRQIADLSGGELQRFACAMVCIQKGDIFMFDEPSSYLDVKQRLKAALAIRDIIRENRLVCFSLEMNFLVF